MKVTRGDTVNMTAHAHYQQTSNSSGFNFTLFITNTYDDTNSENLLGNLSLGLGFSSASGTRLPDVPYAYLKYVVYRADSSIAAEGEQLVTSDAQDSWDTLSLSTVIEEDGYIKIYMVNEDPVDVWFDDITIDHIQSPIAQQTDYYPFGLEIAATQYNRDTWLENRFNRFQGQELDEQIGWVQFKWRNHQPALGRFFNIDPLSEKYLYNSTYAFSENKVVAHVELEGLEAAKSDAQKNENKGGDSPVNQVFSGIGDGFVGFWTGLTLIPQQFYTVYEEIWTNGNFVPAAEMAWNTHVLNLAYHNFSKGAYIAYDVANGKYYSAGSKYGQHLGEASLVLTLEAGVAAFNRPPVPGRQNRQAPPDYAYEGCETIGDGVRTGEAPFGAPASSGAKTPQAFLDYALKRQGLSKPGAGLKESWYENNYKYEVRVHEANEVYGRSGSIYRVSRARQGLDYNGQGYGVEYLDSQGNWHHTRTLKPGKAGNINPNYNAQAAQNTHIEVPNYNP